MFVLDWKGASQIFFSVPCGLLKISEGSKEDKFEAKIRTRKYTKSEVTTCGVHRRLQVECPSEIL